MLTALRDRCPGWRRDAAIAILLAIFAFAVRVDRIGFNSLSEDETAKWMAVEQYRQGHFAGVNSEHPMLPKVLIWASLTLGQWWNKIALPHHWATMNAEGWLRLPNAILGAAIAGILFLLCRRMMGIVGSVSAGFFWAVAPLAVALNRLAKEETPLTCFTLVAAYFYCRAKQAEAAPSARRWYDLSAIAFGLSFASQYIIHLFGINALAWHLAGRAGLDRKPVVAGYKRFLLLLLLTFVVVNPVVLSPGNFHAILQWLHHDGVRHTGYNFDGTLYMNFPGRLLAGVPWYFYLWLLVVKTPVPILLAIVAGSVLLLRDRKTLASCYFLSFGMLQLVALSLSGAKWIRYSLPLLPFLFLAAGYAVHLAWDYRSRIQLSPALAAMAAVVIFGLPLLELHGWAPYYSFYMNAVGGGTTKIAHYFAPDEVSEFDTREVAEQVCPATPAGSRLATARPMSMTYYLQNCGRSDIEIVPLYDRHYAPREGDRIVLEPARRFVETQQFFDLLRNSRMPHHDVRVGPVLASSIYVFDSSSPAAAGPQEPVTLTQLRDSTQSLRSQDKHSVSANLNMFIWSLFNTRGKP